MRSLISCREAKAIGSVYYFTGVPCKYGHVAERRVKNGVCRECDSHRPAQNLPKILNIGSLVCAKCRQTKPTSDFKSKSHKTRSGRVVVGRLYRCKACTVEDAKEKYWENPEKYRKKAKEFNAANPTPNKIRWRESTDARRVARNNGDKYYQSSVPCVYGHISKRSVKTANCYECSMRKRDAWRIANPGKAKLQRVRRRLREKLAEPKWVDKQALCKIYEMCPLGFHVDHIVPLHGKTVCGLHVPWNLQYLTAQENKKKWNLLLDVAS